MPAPQSGQTRLRIAEIKLVLVFLTTANEAIMSLPFLRRFFTADAQNLKRGAAGAFEEGAQGQGLRPLASDSNVRATELPNALLGKERSQLTGNIELPCSQSSHLELLGPANTRQWKARS